MRDTIDMAREAGACDIASHGWTSWVGTQSTEFLKRFEALVRADERDKWMERAHTMILGEREACAKVCEDIGEDLWALYKGRAPYTGKEEGRADMHVQGKSDGADECAAAIRARRNT
jgi:hypothetical protein